jgi:hypothetical protein
VRIVLPPGEGTVFLDQAEVLRDPLLDDQHRTENTTDARVGINRAQ